MGKVPCPEVNEVCKDTIESYSCECGEGYMLTDVEEEGCKSVAIIHIENTVSLGSNYIGEGQPGDGRRWKRGREGGGRERREGKGGREGGGRERREGKGGREGGGRREGEEKGGRGKEGGREGKGGREGGERREGGRGKRKEGGERREGGRGKRKEGGERREGGRGKEGGGRERREGEEKPVMCPFVQAPDIFSEMPTRESVGKALELVHRAVPVTADGATSDELSVTTDLLRNTTSFLLQFQGGSEEAITVNEVG